MRDIIKLLHLVESSKESEAIQRAKGKYRFPDSITDAVKHWRRYG